MNCLYILFTFQQLIFVNLKDDKNKRNTALFCNMKANAAFIVNKEYYCLFCNFRFLRCLFSVVGHGEQIVESNLIINNCRMLSR